MNALAGLDRQLLANHQASLKVQSQYENITAGLAGWEKQGKPRLVEVSQMLKGESFALAARTELEGIDRAIAEIGYDSKRTAWPNSPKRPAGHIRNDFSRLEKAQATLEPIRREIASLQAGLVQNRQELENQSQAYRQACEVVESMARKFTQPGPARRAGTPAQTGREPLQCR